MPQDIFHKYDFENGILLDDMNTEVNPDWALVNCKSVKDFDGFMTDYCWYTNGDKHIFMFGDSDLIEPDEDYADWECDTEKEAQDWFANYTGFEEDDLELESVNSCKKDFINEAFTRLFNLSDAEDIKANKESN